MTANLRISREGAVTRVTLARPGRRNALNAAMCEALVEALESVREGAVLLDGEGKAFCSGMDLDESLDADAAHLGSLHERLFTVGWRMRVPLVAAVHGATIAGGMGLAANAHIVVAAPGSQFGLPEVRVGLWPFIIFRAVEAAVGPRRALAWSLTGESFDAEEAKAAGFVQEIAPAERAAALAQELATCAPDAVRLGLRYFSESRACDLVDAGILAQRLRKELMAGAAYDAAVRARREKRRQ